MLKGLFKTLDPCVVRIPGDILGQVQLSFKYETKRQLLLVKVIQCRDLHCRDVRTKASDPFVKVGNGVKIKYSNFMVHVKADE